MSLSLSIALPVSECSKNSKPLAKFGTINRRSAANGFSFVLLLLVITVKFVVVVVAVVTFVVVVVVAVAGCVVRRVASENVTRSYAG